MTDVAVETSIRLLTSFLKSEISLISNLQDDIRAIKKELNSILEFLKGAEERAVGDVATKVWVKQVRTLAYDIEDVIEEYELFRKENAFHKAISYMSFRVRGMANTVKSIHQRAVEIGRTRDSYSLNRLSSNAMIQQRTSFSSHSISTTTMYIPEPSDQLVGVEIPRKEIIDLLHLRRANNGPTIVAVVGMRGLGKTAVVRCIYNELTSDEFPKRAWIPMSQTRGLLNILRSILQQIYEVDDVNKQHFKRIINKLLHFNNCVFQQSNYVNGIKSLDLNELQTLVIKYLKEERCLIVFDDVQDGDMKTVTCVKQVLSTANRENKILVTTRYENVAHAWTDGSCHGLHRLKPLPHQEAWMLFSKMTFQSCGGNCPRGLEDLAQGIVRKCEGLPPAIFAIGRLLSTKLNDFEEWNKVSESLGFYLEKNPHLRGIHEILIHNYYDLPYHLKPCFLYFGIFPKDYPIERMRLIRLWIAEGFVQKGRDNLTLEEVAEEYLNELISRSLVEVTERTKTLRVHEFLHEIVLSKLHELGFCQILPGNCYNDDEKPRRLSIHKDKKLDEGTIEFLKCITKGKSSTRCIFTFELKDDIMAKMVTTTVLKTVHLLKVLDLCGAPISTVPDDVGKLRNLRYLSLRNTQVKILPNSIGNLQDLQTLDLKQTFICELPVEINKLHKLRHLLTYSYEGLDFSYSSHIQKVRGMYIPQGALGNFRELQKLAFIDLGNGTKVTNELSNLRRFGIKGFKSEDGKDLCVAIEEMKYLLALNVYSKDKNEMIDLEHFQSPPQLLKRLYLNGPLRTFPRWIFELHNLVKLCLRWSRLHDSSLIERLSALPNLAELQLLEAYVGEFLEFTNEGFTKLKILNLLELHGLECLVINEEALPLLEELSIGESPKLQVPSGIEHLHELKFLNFFNMPPHFTDQIRPGERYHKVVQNVMPNVYFQQKCQQGFWKSYTL